MTGRAMTGRPMTAAPVLIGCSHGTADPAGRATIHRLLAAISEARPEIDVREAFVDVQRPDVAQVVTRAAGEGAAPRVAAPDAASPAGPPVVVVPLLLSGGFHVHVDIAEAVAPYGGRAVAAPALGPDPRLVEILVERLEQAGARPGDAVVLAAAGSSDPRATADVEQMAGLLAACWEGPVRPGYGSAGLPRVPQAVEEARRAGASRVVVASYLLAPGWFHDQLRYAGADAVSSPLGADRRVAAIAVERWADAAAVQVDAVAVQVNEGIRAAGG